jgi:VanZ family protein
VSISPTIKNRQSVLLWYWLPPLGWATFLFLSSCIANPPVPPTPPGFHLDKVAHTIEYAVLGALLFRAFLRAESFSTPACILLAITFSTAFGLSDETHQFFVGRDCELGDLLADFFGSTLAALFFAARLGKWENQPSAKKQ